MRTYEVWADGELAKEGVSSLALALHIGFEAACDSDSGFATVWQGSEFTATVDVACNDDETGVEEFCEGQS